MGWTRTHLVWGPTHIKPHGPRASATCSSLSIANGSLLVSHRASERAQQPLSKEALAGQDRTMYQGRRRTDRSPLGIATPVPTRPSGSAPQALVVVYPVVTCRSSSARKLLLSSRLAPQQKVRSRDTRPSLVAAFEVRRPLTRRPTTRRPKQRIRPSRAVIGRCASPYFRSASRSCSVVPPQRSS